MRRSVSIVGWILFAAAACAAQSIYGSTDVKAFREGRDREFRDKLTSPLLVADFEVFRGLEYFEVSGKFVVVAKLEKAVGTEQFMLPTSVGTSRKYYKYGILKFEIDGAAHSLTVFRSALPPKKEEYAGLLFVPFRDLTNGNETYGAGRYLDLREVSGESVSLNFNLAYNPSCAYGSDRYSCAVPPRENFLQVKITAGEKNFVHAAKE
jgi:uncharacterized protein (DUF1684 family)